MITRMKWSPLLLLLSFISLGGVTQDARELVPGVPIERELAGGEAHAYRVTLAAGQFLRVVVDQRAIDVAVAVFRPDGQRLIEIHRLDRKSGPEPASVVAEVPGDYRLEVRALGRESPPGRYQVRIDELRGATPQDQMRVAAERAYAEGRQLRGGPREEALRWGIGRFEEALKLWRTVGDRWEEAETLHRIGSFYLQLGEPQKALEHQQRALPLRQVAADRVGEAATLSGIGLAYSFLGEVQKGLDYMTQVLPLVRALKERGGEAATLNNMGLTYLGLGEYQKALDCLGPARMLYQALGVPGGEAMTLLNISTAYLSLGEHQKALDSGKESARLYRSIGARGDEAHALARVARSYGFLGEHQRALECFNQALSVVQALNDHGGERFTLLLIGEFYSRWGDDQKALAYYGRALTLIRAGDGWEPVIRYGIARGERAQGNLAEAQSQIEAALAILESVRSKIASQQLRASYLASNRDFYEFYVDLLMRLHQRQPSDGHDAAAIEAGERARARSLLETLVEARADIRQGVDASLLERERNLQQRLNAKAERLTQLLSGKHTEEQAVAAKKEVEDLLTQYQEVQAQIRYTSPRYAALTQPQPLGLKEIQQQVLDDDTLLLEYALGEERSFLWAVTPTSISSFELPKRAEIETVARRVYDLMKVSNIRADKEQTEMRTALSRMLLGPVAGQLGKKRLLIVADGALQFVPFAALPKPVNSGQWTVDSKRKVGNCSLTTDHCPLILDHEIVSLPSASVLAVLRREVAGRQPAAKLAAVLADPVFEKNDPRVKARDARRKTQDARPKTSDSKKEPAATDANPQSAIRNPQPDTLTRSARQVGLNGFRRLAQSRREADALVALTPAGQSLKAVDFDASKPVALSKALSQYRIVHFATHGLVNSEHPELSGLVLSLVNEQGEAQDGFLRLHDIYNLGLGADLVVLSACQTALGKEIKGEGLVGLTRGFMYAGATGVVASLWDVSDLGGARLMKRFYEGLLKKGLKPAAALRAAQLSLWKEARWKPAYYWAGFLFQGEWK